MQRRAQAPEQQQQRARGPHDRVRVGRGEILALNRGLARRRGGRLRARRGIRAGLRAPAGGIGSEDGVIVADP